MRGDALIAAPLVDKLCGRKVHWYSGIALLLVASALIITIRQRGGLRMPLLCILTILLNLLGYFLRLLVMSRSAKNTDPEALKRYFTEEQLVAYPLALAVLGGVAWVSGSQTGLDLRWGFFDLWSKPMLWALVVLGATVSVQGVVAAMILLGKRENTYCVPLERSASVIGGVIAAYFLWRTRNYLKPTSAEMIGIMLLVMAIVILSIGPRLAQKAASKITTQPEEAVTEN